MTGHESLIEMRLNGYMPKSAFVTVIEDRPEWGSFSHPDQAMALGGYPDIVIMPEDNPASVDLRCLRGVLVHVAGLNRNRTVAALERIAEFEPLKAIAGGPWGLRAWKPNKGFFDLL